jgi:uncharacterized membrane protein YkoI
MHAESIHQEVHNVKKEFEMKKWSLPLATVCVLLATSSVQTWADKIPAGDVPKPLLKAIGEQVRVHGQPAKEVEREIKNGKTTYEVEFSREGINKHLKCNEDGTLVAERALGGLAPSRAVNTLPAPVQKTVEQQRAGRVVTDIDEEKWDGKTVYELEFKE